MDSIQQLERARDTRDDRRQFLLNLICFAACIEGLFFFAAFAYVYFLRRKGLLHGLAAGTNWVFRDESAHMEFAFEVVKTVRREEPELFDAEMRRRGRTMMDDAIDVRGAFAEDLWRRRRRPIGRATCASISSTSPISASPARDAEAVPREEPLLFMELQDVQELTNFFERRVSAYQVGVTAKFVRRRVLSAGELHSRSEMNARPKKVHRRGGGKRIADPKAKAKKTTRGKTTTKLLVAMTGKASAAKAAEGDEPVFAYIASLPQPQREIAEHIDALAAKTLPVFSVR